MFKAILYTQWKWSRLLVLAGTVTAFAVPILSVQGLSVVGEMEPWRAHGLLRVAESRSVWYAVLAGVLGLLSATTFWHADHRGRHQYALSLPVADLSTVDQLSQIIRRHLRDRRVLVLLDDAWSGDSIQPFLVGSKAIVTTRNRALLDSLRVDHEMVEIPPMTLGEAQVMVRQGTGQGIEYNDPRLYELHERTDGLPQALKLALSGLPELGWEQVLGFLREETSRPSLLEQGEGRSRAESIRASFALSYGRLRPEQQRLFRVLGVFAPAPLSAQAVQAVYLREAWRPLK